MLPAYTRNYKQEDDYGHFARIAALRNQDITTGYLARPDNKAHQTYNKKIIGNLERGDLAGEPNSLFIARKEYISRLKKLVANGQVKAFLYEDYVVAAPLKMEKTIQYLSQLPNCQTLTFDKPDLTAFLKMNLANKIILAVAKDEATFKLCDEAKQQFAAMGTDMNQLRFRGSFAAIFVDGKSIFHSFEDGKAVLKTIKKGEILRGSLFQKTIELESAGGESGNFGKIKVDGKDLSPASRGLNFVVLDKQFNVLKTAYFDTYDDCATGEVRNY
jgi:hypothetical protein